MEIPTLVVSDPPHGEVDIEAAADLMELDVFAARLKAHFAAPEIMLAAGADEAGEFLAALAATGFEVQVVPGGVLAELPWPDPVSTLAFDATSLRATGSEADHEVAYDAEVVGVCCRPPADRSRRSLADVERAIASGHGPTIAEAIQRRSIIDLYYLDADGPRRLTIVPELLKEDDERLKKEIVRRFERLDLDERLAGVKPRAPFRMDGSFDGSERRRYSFGTQRLREVLEAIAPELRAVPQYEFGSRLAFALSPLARQLEKGPSP
jgi:hypothetical protein